MPFSTAEPSQYFTRWQWSFVMVGLMFPIVFPIILIANLPVSTFVRGSLLLLTLTCSLLWLIATLALFSESVDFTAVVLFFSFGLCLTRARVSLSSISQKLREQMHTLGFLALSIRKRRSDFGTAPQSGVLCVTNYCVSTRPAFKNVTD